MSLLLGSCAETKTKKATYYNIDSLLNAQINYLAKAEASVIKVATLSGKESHTVFAPLDTTGWLKELDVFRNINVINKPINRGAYKVEEGLSDPRSNLNIKSVTGNGEDLTVEYLKIYYHGTINNIKRLEAKYNEENSMYKGSRFLVMEFQNINNTAILTYYSVVGGQQMFLGDSVQYRINASISLKEKQNG